MQQLAAHHVGDSPAVTLPRQVCHVSPLQLMFLLRSQRKQAALAELILSMKLWTLALRLPDNRELERRSVWGSAVTICRVLGQWILAASRNVFSNNVLLFYSASGAETYVPSQSCRAQGNSSVATG